MPVNPPPLISAMTAHTIMMAYSRKNLIFPTIPAPEIPPEMTKNPISIMVMNKEIGNEKWNTEFKIAMAARYWAMIWINMPQELSMEQ